MATALLIAIGPAALGGQSANEGLAAYGAGPGSPAARADSIAQAGDTTAALALLERSLRRNPRDAVAWYYRGMFLWAQTGLTMRPNVFSSQKMAFTVAAADSSLRMATLLAPDSARYFVSLGRFTLGSGYSFPRAAVRGQASNGIDAAIRTGDRATLAVVSDIAGMIAWRDYEYLGNRGLLSDGRRVELTGNDNFMRKDAADVVASYLKRIEPPTGTQLYDTALGHFRTAVGADSSNLRFSRHLFMALAARHRWEELLDVTTRRGGQFPLDFQARLGRGLALHRLGRAAEANAAFDSALALMDEREAARLTRFTRLLRPKSFDKRSPATDTARFNAMAPEERRGLEAMYWMMNDPLTLTAENELRLEFLARVTYADFRWTDDDLELFGADTDRGDIHVRYGPPLMEVTAPGGNGLNPTITVMWEYPTRVFFFDLAPSFNTARIAWNDKDYVDRFRDAVPASFDNVASMRRMDTLPVRVARFRAGGDSTDAVITAHVPLDSLVGTARLDQVAIDVDFRVFDQFVRLQGVESERRRYAVDSMPASDRRQWTRRLGPGINVVRVEALQAEARRAARGTARLHPVPSIGFGMSDVLLGSKPAPRTAQAPARWRDVALTPSDGTIPRGTALGLLWELYELAARDGDAKYRVSISVGRADRRWPLGFAIRAMDGVGRALGRAQTSRDKFTISFARTSPAAATLVEFLSLDMSEAPTGRYTLRVEVSDLATGKKALRDTEFSIR